MALRFMDGFDHYTTLGQKWTTLQDGGIAAAQGRFGTAAHSGSFNQFTQLRRLLDAQATWIAGIALKPQSTPTDTNGLQYIIALLDGGAQQFELRYESATNKIRLTRAGTQLALSTQTFDPTIFNYFELKVTIHNSTGIAIARVNGQEVLNISGADTQATANATADEIGFVAHSDSQANNWYSDDIYICDGTGAAPTNDFLGDVRVETVLPGGNGTTSQFDGSDGNQIDNYLLVDETAPDEDTTYVESGIINNKDTYAYGNLATTAGTVYGVQLSSRARKTDAGSRSFATIAKIGATEVDGPNNALATGFTTFREVREAKPGGGVWTIADVNAAEFGQKVTV